MYTIDPKTIAILDANFKVSKLSGDTLARAERISLTLRNVAGMIGSLCPACRETGLAYLALEDAQNWILAALARETKIEEVKSKKKG